jgi:hypothetical protein
MRKIMVLFILLLTYLSTTIVAQARIIIQDAEAQAAWREDLQVAVERMEAIHPNLFWRTPEEEFRQQVDDFDAEIPYLTDNQIIMGFARVFAHGGGHTYVWMLQEQTGFRLYPLRLYWFSDGLYVIDAREEELIGARVIQVGDATVEEAYEQFVPMISNDNDTAYLLWSPMYFVMPELLEGLGFIDAVNEPNFLLEAPDGEQFVYNAAPASVNAYGAWNDGWLVGYPQQSEPLYLSRHFDENFWYTYLEDSQTLYIQYNHVMRGTQSGISLSAFSSEIEDFIAEQNIERVVIDLRHNGGGDNTTYFPLLSLLREETINQPGKLFAIIGRQTFSAAMNFVSDLEPTTEVLFVGEPTGSRPNHYGDSVPFTLPNSGLVVNVSPQYLQDSTPDDTRPWIEPDIPATLSSEDYFNGRDPALEAILSYEG